MSTKLSKFLLPVSRQGTTEACRQAAFSLARDFAARLEVLHSLPRGVAASALRLGDQPVLFPGGSRHLPRTSFRRAVGGESLVRAGPVGAPRPSADFRCIEGFPPTTMAGRARVADLSVVPSIAPREDEFWMAVRDAALFQSGRPVLVIPEETPSRFGETIVVAWKDSVESVRAVTAAEPFLAKA